MNEGMRKEDTIYQGTEAQKKLIVIEEEDEREIEEHKLRSIAEEGQRESSDDGDSDHNDDHE